MKACLDFLGRVAAEPRAWLVVSSVVGAAVAGGCNIGGLNDGVKAPGDEPGGVKIAAGDIAVAPDGSYFLFEREDQLAVGWVGSGAVELLPVESPSRLAFSSQRRMVYVTTELGMLVAVDIDSRSEAWSVTTGLGQDPMVVSSEDDTRIAIGSGTTVRLFEAEAGGDIATKELDSVVVDIEVLPDDERLLVVERHAWPAEAASPKTAIHVVGLADGTSRTFDVPNCSDDIVVPKHGKMALLAPTLCEQEGAAHDPISHIDLEPGNERFIRNLPGFGPVALGPDGELAVGFFDGELADASLFDDPADIPPASPRFYLMVIDTTDMAYDFYAYGDERPRYAITPDGSVLLVDQAALEGKARLFDLEDRDYRDISGGLDSFEQLSFSRDSKHAYVLSDLAITTTADDAWMDYVLYDLDIESASASSLPTDFRPRNVNVSPDDQRLFLRRDDSRICIYSLATQGCEQNVTLTSP
jgi:hypothetical protein